MKNKLPKTLYVKIEQDGNKSYPVAADDPLGLAELGEKTRIGVYSLTRIEDIEGVVKRTAR
jgi:hypothetical protein